jgi:hypothetical protein
MNGPSLKRTTFTTSRLLEFCSTRELTNLIGHDTHEWPLVVIKELVDNSLDAAEEAGVAPCIEIEVSTADRTISVTDNGPGIPAKTVASILDFSSRTSSKEAYCSPTRGQQGHALSTILAMPFALARGDEAPGQIIIGNPFKAIGKGGDSLDSLLASLRVQHHDKAILFVHVACPTV